MSWLTEYYWLAGKLGDDPSPANTAREALKVYFENPEEVKALQEPLEHIISQERMYGAATNVKPWKDHHLQQAKRILDLGEKLHLAKEGLRKAICALADFDQYKEVGEIKTILEGL